MNANPSAERAYVAVDAEEKFTYQVFPSCIPDFMHKHWTIIESKVQLSRAILHHDCWFNVNELESCELLNIQRSSIKLLYAQLSKTKAFLFIRPEVVEEWISDKPGEAKVEENSIKVPHLWELLEQKFEWEQARRARTWTLKLYYIVISNRE